MPPNLSMSTGFDLFRKSNLLTAHEHVANSYIDANCMCTSICCAFAGDQESSLRTADAFPVFASPSSLLLFFGGREATTGNASAVRRLPGI